MKSWEYLQARRGTSLEAFLDGVKTLDEALKRFRARDIVPPPTEAIEEVLGVSTKAADVVTARPSKKTPSSRPSTKKRKAPQQVEEKKAKEYDDLVIIETEETATQD
jgi:hypothetical protein